MNVLNSLYQKNGEWYYISSMANMGMGNNVKALGAYPGSCAVWSQNNTAVSYASEPDGRRRKLV